MGRIYIVRHGETEWNKHGRYQGQKDIPLSKEGKHQAERIALRLASRKIKAVFSSDLQRAKCTAEKIASYHKISIETNESLREMSFGIWEGLTRKEIQEKYPELYQQRKTLWETTRIPGAETPGEVQKRIVDCLQKINDMHPNDEIVVVSHGGAIRLAIGFFLKLDSNQIHRFQLDNAGLSIISHKHDWFIEAINDTGHLA